MNRSLAPGLAAALALAAPAFAPNALAQSANPVQQQGGPAVEGQTALQAQVRAIEGALRQSGEQLDRGQPGGAPNYEQARAAVRSGLGLVAQMPLPGQNADNVHRAGQALRTAESAVTEERADPRIASANLRSAAEALAAVHGDLGGAARNAGPQQGNAAGSDRRG
ncbi:hypothetical protein ACE7GA_20165 [Roseomonas sp. CCTCC AB2023176]|uniref:hypothetical protein n=1 Tax=Roseomonas sp. CCTCC AB2023176 TaxID=3342640 RepID=UPI0035DE55AE